MNTKHTHGPWKVGPTFEDGDIQILIPNELGTVAMVHNHAVTASDPDTMEAQAIANATLIAAAPDLLEACLQAISDIENGDTEKTIRMLSAAIAKAGGR